VFRRPFGSETIESVGLQPVIATQQVENSDVPSAQVAQVVASSGQVEVRFLCVFLVFHV